jgi:hypothetical protein
MASAPSPRYSISFGWIDTKPHATGGGRLKTAILCRKCRKCIVIVEKFNTDRDQARENALEIMAHHRAPHGGSLCGRD